jgi:uncharacterized membrane protein YfcA
MGPSLLVDGVAVSIAGVAALGIGIGDIVGMFGIGGGVLLTPLLVVVFRVPLPIAVGTGLCQMIGTSLVSFLPHPRARQGELRFDLLMLPGCLLGVEAGARTLTYVAGAGSLWLGGRSIPWVSAVVEGSFVLMLLAVAWSYWRQGGASVDALQYLRPGPFSRMRLGPAIDLPRSGLRRVSAVIVAQIGLALGFVSGMLGIGGGVALNPVLVYGYGFPVRQAAGTGIAVLFVTAVVGTVAHALRGHVHLGLATVMLVGATISAQAGALASRRLSGRALGRILSLVILAAVGAVLWDLASQLGRHP